MEGYPFSIPKFKRHLSHYKISICRVSDKGGFKNSNHIDTIKPGTLLGFADKEGNSLDIDEYYTKKSE